MRASVPRCAAAAPATPAVKPAPERSKWYAEPVKVFDNLYYVGMTEYSAWAVTTSAGIILVDTLYDYSVEAEVVEGELGGGAGEDDAAADAALGVDEAGAGEGVDDLGEVGAGDVAGLCDLFDEDWLAAGGGDKAECRGGVSDGLCEHGRASRVDGDRTKT